MRRGKSAGRGSFSFTDFPWHHSASRDAALPDNLPGGVPERIKRGKEKVVTRAVAYAEMKL